MSQFDAAERLGVCVSRIEFLIQSGQHAPVHDSRGRAGVDRASLQREEDRRRDAGLVRRVRLLVADIGRSIGRGI